MPIFEKFMKYETKALYLVDSYLKEVTAKVISVVDRSRVILDKTIFYPRGGGQPEDRGKIITSDGEIFELIRLERDESGLIHIIEEGLSEDEDVILKVDWEYRYRLMKHHTSLHILSAMVNRKYDETKVTGGQIYYDKARLDFDLPIFNKEMGFEIVEELNNIIKENHNVTVSFMKRSEAEKIPELFRTNITLPKTINVIRIVKIGNVDIQADGGLHVNNTSEIGEIKLLKTANKGKGRKRVSISIVD